MIRYGYHFKWSANKQGTSLVCAEFTELNVLFLFTIVIFIIAIISVVVVLVRIILIQIFI